MGVRTVGLFAHAGAGKTSLAEKMLAITGVAKKPGSVENGTSMLDFEAVEKDHRTTVYASTAHFSWKDSQVDLIDSPGSQNFIGETVGAIRVCDGAVMMSSAEPGIHGETDFLWERLENQGVARLLVLSHMDRDQADFDSCLANLNNSYDNRLIAINIPIGKGSGFSGVVDLVSMKALDFSTPGKPKAADIPGDILPQAEEQRYRLVESAAEADDDLLEKYLETEELSTEEIIRGLRRGVKTGKLVPVLAASRNIGVESVMDAMVNLLPDFEECRERRSAIKTGDGYISDGHPVKNFAALVFKTKVDQYAGKLSFVKVLAGELKPGLEMFNVSTDNMERPAHIFKLQGKEQVEVKSLGPGEIGVLPKLSETHSGNTLCSKAEKVEYQPIDFPAPVLSYAFKLSAKGEEEKLSTALHRIIEEDPTLSFRHNGETGDFLVAGMGQIHLDLTKERLAREYNLKSEFKLPHVPYRETIRSSAKAQGKYKKQTGGRGQYGDCWLEIKPNGQEEQLLFESAIVGGVIPKGFIPAVEKGVSEALHKGIVAGYPVIGINAKVYDGSYHDVDSSEMAFKIAGSMAFKKAMEEARPVLLEPIYKLDIVVPSEYMGDVMGDINGRRGKVLGMDSQGRRQLVRAEVPMSEALIYAVELRAMTSGQGIFTQEFSHYEQVPDNLSDKIIQARANED
ncbi:MAG: elongation factor G [Deltaproteobacteria bacterium]|nr:elongation factor G [Deltaproteobacteria bacterium]